MAYTRIHAIKTTVHKSIEYICNPDKTEETLLVDSYECFPETAAYNFKQALSKTSKSSKNLAYHLIQSFNPGEVSHEEAHRIGIELADRLLLGNYSYVVATHTDRDHPHNHIIFCAANNTDHRKFNDNLAALYHIRQLSDRLCIEHGLSVITPESRKGKSYTEWKTAKEGSSWKSLLRKDIDEMVEKTDDYWDFISEMRKKGYVIKGADFGEKSLKYISFKAPGQQRFIRGSAKSLGKGYTKEDLKDSIENKKKYLQNSSENKVKQHQQDILKRSSPQKKLIDTSGEKFAKSPGLKRWADRQNLKTAAANYAEAGSLSELSEKIEKNTIEAGSARTELAATERQLKDLKELQYQLNQYKENLPFHQSYKKATDADRYFRMHESELILFDGAKRKLHQK